MIEFLDAPPEAHTYARSRVNRDFAKQLRERPGAWAEYPHHAADPYSAATRIRTGRTRAFGRGYEARVSGKKLYVTYVGDTTDTPDAEGQTA
ncbi:hypothetical protein ACWEQ4_01415 [Rhodococcus sp. NPDC003994]